MRVLLGLVCLLAAATSAGAEGAWLLWSQDVATEPELVPVDSEAWRRIGDFDSKSACFLDASTKAEDQARILRSSEGADSDRRTEVQRLGLGADHLAVKSMFTGGLFDGARMWTFYKCLPDTVDPRGPKAR